MSKKTATDDLLANNAEYAEGFAKADLPVPPAMRVALVTCMDARIETGRALGIGEGDIHVIRNAGGVVTDDVIRSLTISQRLLGTREIIVVHHTDCGMVTFTDDGLKADIEAEVGIRPPFAFEAFSDVEEDVRQSMRRIRQSAFIPHKDQLRGFVYHVETGRLEEVFD